MRTMYACCLCLTGAALSVHADLPNWSFSNIVTVDTDSNEGFVSEDLMSVCHVYDRTTDWKWNNRFVPHLNELDVRFIRYCGGEVADRFHYLEPDGDGFKDSWHQPVDNVNHWEWMNPSEYMDIFVNNTIPTAKPLIGINIESDRKFIVNNAPNSANPLTVTGNHRDNYTVTNDEVIMDTPNGIPDYQEEALAWVKDNEYYYSAQNPDHYFIGNECYLNHTHQPMAVERYAEYINELAPLIKSENPNAKIIINWRGKWTPEWNDLFRPPNAGGAGGNFDYIDLHMYWDHDGWGTSSWENWRSTVPIKRGDLTYQETFQNLRSALDAHGLDDVKIGVFEWNNGVVYNASGQQDLDLFPSSYQLGIMNAQTFMSFVESKVDAACIWPLTWEGGWGGKISLLKPGSGEKTVTFEMLNFLKPATASGSMKLLNSHSNQDGTITFSVGIDFSDGGRRIYTYLLNKRSYFVGTTLDTGSFDPDKVAVRVLCPTETVYPTSSQSGTAGNTASDGFADRWIDKEEISPGKVRFILAPYSLTRVALTQ